MLVHPPPALEMLILTTGWDKGTICDICAGEIAINTVWIEHLEGGCTREPCPHGIEDSRGEGYDCILMRHDKVHFRHLSPSFSCLPEEAQARARVHWKGCI